MGVKRGNLYPWKERKVLNGVFGEKRQRGFLAMWHLEPSREFALKENHLHKNAVMLCVCVRACARARVWCVVGLGLGLSLGVCGFVGLWVCGCVGVWVCGFVCVCACVF